MKTLLYTICIFAASVMVAPVEAAANTTAAKETGLFIRDPFVNQKSAKRFRKSGKVRRGKKTCMKKGGCSGKSLGLFRKKRGKCNNNF